MIYPFYAQFRLIYDRHQTLMAEAEEERLARSIVLARAEITNEKAGHAKVPRAIVKDAQLADAKCEIDTCYPTSCLSAF